MPHPFALGSHTKWAAIRLIFFCLQKCAKNPRPFAFAIACQWPLGSLTKRAAIYLLFFRLQKCAEISRAFALVATWQSHKTGSNLPSFFLYSETHRNFTSLCTRSCMPVSPTGQHFGFFFLSCGRLSLHPLHKWWPIMAGLGSGSNHDRVSTN